MLQDPQVMAAVSRIVQRSERQEDIQKLVGTYVDVGLLPQLDNTNHQIFYGRRGTGKTHVMKVLESRLREDDSRTVVYIDCRTLGSTAQFTDGEMPISRRCLSLFRDILLCVYHELLEHIIEFPSSFANQALQEADELSRLITEPLQTLKAEKVVLEDESSSVSDAGATGNVGVSIESPAASLEVTGKRAESQLDRKQTQYVVDSQEKIIFPELHRSLQRVLELADTRLFVLVDEWSSLPQVELSRFAAA